MDGVDKAARAKSRIQEWLEQRGARGGSNGEEERGRAARVPGAGERSVIPVNGSLLPSRRSAEPLEESAVTQASYEASAGSDAETTVTLSRAEQELMIASSRAPVDREQEDGGPPTESASAEKEPIVSTPTQKEVFAAALSPEAAVETPSAETVTAPAAPAPEPVPKEPVREPVEDVPVEPVEKAATVPGQERQADPPEPEAAEATAVPGAAPESAPEAVPGSSGFVPPPVLTRPVHSSYHARELPGQEWAAPDTVIDEADYEGLHLRAASLRGDKHRFEGKTRQDAFGLYEFEHSGHRLVFACVADGVGSRSRSHRGAAYVCRVLPAAVAQNIDEAITGEWEDVQAWGNRMAGVVARGMIDLAEKEHFSPDELSTTFTAVLIRLPEEGRKARYLTMSVGDSPVFRLEAGAWRPLNVEPDDGGLILDTRTDALPDRVGAVAMDEGALEPGDVLLLCTDGLSGPMSAPAVAGRLADWWGSGRIPGRMEFGWQLDFQAKSYNDDRTAVCVWRT
ncbi:protein phosphatase 2C domain-containing protein [Nocardiopsis sp. NPDC006139]|uniref:protein phosphatase 2C domain-containing protein n=1 Tax=unclassified Nocardiopsis TaxID=2649073 RepID=UPI0033AA48EF